MKYHVFISHASEDNNVAIPLAKKLEKLGIKVWLNEFQLTYIENIQRSIEQGISESQYGVVILSPYFFKMKWTKNEIKSLLSGDNKYYKENILHIWHNIDIEEVKKFSPILAEKKTAVINKKFDNIAELDLKAIGRKSPQDLGYSDFIKIVKMIDSVLNEKPFLAISERNSNNTSPKLLPNLLEKYEDFVNELLKDFDNRLINSYKNPAVFILQQIREILKAELIYYIRINNNKYDIIYENRSSNLKKDIDSEKIDNIVKEAISPYFDLSFPCFLKFDNINIKGLKKDNCIAIPIKGKSEKSLILIISYSESLFLDDVIGIIFNALYKITNSFSRLMSQKIIRSAIYDEIKTVYNFVSRNMYYRRFSDFCDSLQNLQMKFEPIVHISTTPDDIYITGWEALARSRDMEFTDLPAKLFKTAIKWGVRFQTELDLYCLRKALESYVPQNRKQYPRLPIFVNVYPDSILRTVFKKELAKLKAENLLSDDNRIILEINEKTLATSLEPGEGIDHPLEEFKRAMNQLSNMFGIQFAIDDFGVDYSSISRLNRLLPSYIKIDRDILHYEYNLGKAVIRYLKGLRNITFIGGMKVIIEGLDNQSKISLSELVNELHVRYAQGHLLGKATSKIYRLTKRKKAEIAKLINSNNSRQNPNCPLCGEYNNYLINYDN